MKKTAVTRTAYYPVTLVPVHSLLCTSTMLVFKITQIYELLFYSNPQGGQKTSSFWFVLIFAVSPFLDFLFCLFAHFLCH